MFQPNIMPLFLLMTARSEEHFSFFFFFFFLDVEKWIYVLPTVPSWNREIFRMHEYEMNWVVVIYRKSCANLTHSIIRKGKKTTTLNYLSFIQNKEELQVWLFLHFFILNVFIYFVYFLVLLYFWAPQRDSSEIIYFRFWRGKSIFHSLQCPSSRCSLVITVYILREWNRTKNYSVGTEG